MPFVATWIQLKIVILKSDRERQISHDMTHMWKLIFLNDTSEQILK